MKVLLPVSLDRTTSPMATLLRAVVAGNPEATFYSYSNPLTDEDRTLAESLWRTPHLHRQSPARSLMRAYEIVHVASATPKNLLASRAAKWRSGGRTRFIFTANCQPYPTDPYLTHLRRAARSADQVVAVSQAVADSLRESFGVDAHAVIPNGFDPALYQPLAPGHPDARANRLAAGKGFVLYVSALLDRKRPEFLLDLAGRMPDVAFVMVANPRPSTFSDHIRARAESAPNVAYFAQRTRMEVRDLMQQASALAFPSDFEGLPLTVVEAIGTGLPVIAQPKSALPEVIVDGINGWLVSAEDPESWIARLRDVFSWTESRWNDYQPAARQTVLQRFSWQEIGTAYADLYRTLV